MKLVIDYITVYIRQQESLYAFEKIT